MVSGSGAGLWAANLNTVKNTIDNLLEISRILNIGLDMETLSICVQLCEQELTWKLDHQLLRNFARLLKH